MTSLSKARSATTQGENRSDIFNSLDKIEEILFRKISFDQQVIATDRLHQIDVLELLQILKILRKEHGYIDVENAVLESFLAKADPNVLQTIYDLIDRQSKKEQTKIRIISEKDSSTPRNNIYNKSQSNTSIKSKGSRSTQIGAVKLANEWKLNYTFKNELTEKLCTELNMESEDRKKKGIKELREVYSSIEELKYRLNEIGGTIKGFKKNVVEIAYNPKTGILPTEKFLKYFNNWVTNAMATVSTMRLRTQTLRDSCRAIRALIIKKKDLSGLITAVDFEALKLRKNDYIRILEDRSENLLKIKQVSAKASTELVQNKNLLAEIEINLRKINEKIVEGKSMITKINGDIVEVEKEIKYVRADIYELKTKIEEFSAPTIEEYINMKDRISQLEKIKNNATRRNQILKLQLKTKQQALKNINI